METELHPLRVWRKEQGLTLASFAARLKRETGRRIRPSFISMIEKRKREPSLPVAVDLSRTSGIPADEFVLPIIGRRSCR